VRAAYSSYFVTILHRTYNNKEIKKRKEKRKEKEKERNKLKIC